jgi:PIN domain nuclease of toxin-antitoxin system
VPSRSQHQFADPSTFGFVSVATLWEVAIRVRLGKLDPGMRFDSLITLPDICKRSGLSSLRYEALTPA